MNVSITEMKARVGAEADETVENPKNDASDDDTSNKMTSWQQALHTGAVGRGLIVIYCVATRRQLMKL